jgi:hypothetical protein
MLPSARDAPLSPIPANLGDAESNAAPEALQVVRSANWRWPESMYHRAAGVNR